MTTQGLDVQKVTKHLIKYETTRENKKEIQDCFEYIKQHFNYDIYQIEEYNFSNTKSIVITFNDEDPEVILHGHIDVVEASDEMFDPETKEDRIYGRGSADMKAGIACLMSVMKNLEEQKPSVGLMIVSDEEIGGFNGAKKLFKQEYNPGFAISAEPNNMQGYMDIITDQKGILHLKLKTEGDSAHASKPWKGDNAAEKMMEKLTQIKKLFENPENGEKWVTTINIGKLRTGNSLNKVPNEAEAWLDIRTTRKYPNQKVIDYIKDLNDLTIDEIILNESMLATDKKNPYVQELKRKADEIIEDTKVTRKEPGSDMRFLTEQDTPAVVFGPEGYNSHSRDEYAVKSSFEDYIEILSEYLKNLD